MALPYRRVGVPAVLGRWVYLPYYLPVRGKWVICHVPNSATNRLSTLGCHAVGETESGDTSGLCADDGTLLPSGRCVLEHVLGHLLMCGLWLSWVT